MKISIAPHTRKQAIHIRGFLWVLEILRARAFTEFFDDLQIVIFWTIDEIC